MVIRSCYAWCGMADQDISRKLAVIVHADVAGSTALVQRDETLAHKRINEAFRRFSSIIQEYNGTVHEIRGDALVAGFARASDAVCAAISFQRSNTAHNAQLDDDIVPVVRVGIALGEEIFADDTVTGPGVVLAQRVEQLAEPGGVCITSAIHEAIPNRMPFDQESLGEQDVKGFDESVRVYRVALKPGELIPPPETSKQAHPPSRTRRLIVAFAALVLLVAGGLVVWLKPWAPEFEPASVERMAFPLPDKPSIAVLPFDNLGGDPEQEVLSDGLTNDIITDLSKFKHLFVIASNSTFSYKGKAVKVQQVAEELGVRYVLEGSFQRAGERLRINVQLIDATTGHHLWAERYDRNASDFFTIQDDISRTIVGSLASQVTEAEIKHALGKETDDLGAYDYYQRAWKLFFTFSKEANNQALELLEKAIELDPDYARAYGLLSWVHAHNSSQRYSWGQNPERSLDLALESARKAIALAPDDYFSHWALGFALSLDGDFDRASAGYERALALNPSDTTLLANMSEVLYKTGRAEQAIAQIKLAIRINPRHPEWYLWDLGIAQYFAEQYQEALDTLNRMSNPSNGVRRIRAAVLVRLGRLEEAREVMSKFIETDLDSTLEEMEDSAWKDREYLDRWIDDLRTAGLPERRPLPIEVPSG